MSESEPLDKTSELYIVFPFMEAFPFEDYELTLEMEGTDPADIGVAPILIQMLGTFGTDTTLNFSYLENETSITISLYQEDVYFISEEAKNISKLNLIREQLDAGLASDNLELKIENIRKGRKFVSGVGSENLSGVDYNMILADIITMNEASLTSTQMHGLLKLNHKKIIDMNPKGKDLNAIIAYLNFQLHYSRTILGIVIATKIY